MNVKVAFAITFWDQLLELPRAQQKKVRNFVTKFQASPTAPGLNFERIKTAADKSYRSLRIDQTYRCIVMAPEQGDVYVLLWVDHHDDAYAWARRNRAAVNPTTGVLQLYELDVIENPGLESQAGPAAATAATAATSDASTAPPSAKDQHGAEAAVAAAASEPLFNLDDSRLLLIGVPESMLPAVMALRTEAELESLQSRLPIDAFDALTLFAGGVEWDDIVAEYGAIATETVDTNDIAAAIERDGSKRLFHVVESDAELQSMLAAPLEKWRVYLHPSQRRLVERDWNGALRVLGGAGTGKTVVAMHRAAWLVRNRLASESSARVLFLTYNTNLAQDIKQNLSKITTPDELKRIEVINIDAWVAAYLKRRAYRVRIVGDAELRPLWRDVIDGNDSPPGKDLPRSFYTEEWERVVLPNRIRDRQAYLRVSRTGRGVPLNRPQRAHIWDIFDDMQAELQHRGWRTYQQATHDAADFFADDSNRPRYQHVIVDETQDMGHEALRLIRELVPEGKNDLFLVGDGHQRIYRRRAVMSRAGINIRGRGKKLKINYRTTEQIRRFAAAILDGQPIDDLDGDTDTSNDYRSLTRGPEPVLQACDNEADELAWIVSRANALTDADETGLAHCCLMLRTRKLRDRYAQLLRDAGVPVVVLEHGADNQAVPGIRVATLHRVKGLEFRHVFLASMSNSRMPNNYAVSGSEDKTEIREHELAERALLHVAATRAVENLMVSWFYRRCDFFGS